MYYKSRKSNKPAPHPENSEISFYLIFFLGRISYKDNKIFIKHRHFKILYNYQNFLLFLFEIYLVFLYICTWIQ